MCSARDGAALPAPGCPIRESAGQRPFSASPRLIAAVHALHRLLMPRHPPCALNILTVIRSHPTAPCGGRRADPVIPVFSRRLSGRLMWLCAVFKDRGEAHLRRSTAPRRASLPDSSAGGRRSLKTQQHAGRLRPRRAGLPSSTELCGARSSSQARSTC